MAMDTSYSGTGSELTDLVRYYSGCNVAETTGALSAVVKVRDSIKAAGVPVVADGAAGNSTIGLHMFSVVGVTKYGETSLGTRVELDSAGTTILEVTAIPTYPIVSSTNDKPSLLDEVVGRRIYMTKAGAPATTVIPTLAQWFLVAADASSTLASGENGLSLPQGTLTVASGTNFATSGKLLVTTDDGIQVVTYTGKSTNDLTGCTGGTGRMSTGGAVTQAMIGNNTATTYSIDLADGSLTSTIPGGGDTAGSIIEWVNVPAGTSVDTGPGSNVVALGNDGGVFVEVTSGTVNWRVRGR